MAGRFCSLVVRARSKVQNPEDPVITLLKGDVRRVGPPNHLYGAQVGTLNEQGFFDTVIIDVSGASSDQLRHLSKSWDRSPVIDRISVVEGIDVVSLRIKGEEQSVAGLGGYPESVSGGMIRAWAGTVSADDARTTSFDLPIFAASTSPGYFSREVGDVVFNEVSYIDGRHLIEADYSALVVPDGRVASVEVAHRLETRRISILDNTNDVITYETTRDQIESAFFAQLLDETEASVASSRYSISNAIVDEAIAAGGRVSKSLVDIQLTLEDRADG